MPGETKAHISILLCIFMLLALFINTIAYAQSNPSKKHLVIATTDSWHPYSYTNEKGEPMGVLVNFWQEYAERTGTSVEFKVSNWQESINNVLSGQADAHIGMVRSDKREQYFDFIEPFFGIDTKLYFNRALLEQFSVKDFLVGQHQYPVGVLFGGYQQDYMQSHYPNVPLITFTNNQQMMEEALAGRLKAFVADTQVTNYFLNLGNKPGKILPVQHLYTGVLYSGVAKNNPLRDELLVGFSLFSPEDKLRIVNRWMHHSIETVYPRYLIPALVTFVLVMLSSYIMVLKKSVAKQTKQLREMNDQLITLSHTDSLTNIHNRRYFMLQLEAIKDNRYGIGLVIADIDNFKLINDKFGHDVGDQVIQFVARKAKELLSNDHTLARIGGEEFAMIVCYPTVEVAESLAQTLVDNIREQSRTQFPQLGQITVSIGLAYYPEPKESYNLVSADHALYQAKNSGKNRVVCTIDGNIS
ncbi:diguanylate cyclase domain-containing protein [Vibrio cholerae]|uniref:transporter substrate-binding domain-containing diguanylate cyclase n=1 Tax=Vibrio cholerae TaxID=666 RepID=UPI0020C67933|nr:sensor domain-containing diguanylate cyclase [Vibrio cholerae]